MRRLHDCYDSKRSKSWILRVIDKQSWIGKFIFHLFGHHCIQECPHFSIEELTGRFSKFVDQIRSSVDWQCVCSLHDLDESLSFACKVGHVFARIGHEIHGFQLLLGSLNVMEDGSIAGF